MMMMTMMRRTRRKRRRLMWWRWRRDRRWNAATPARRRRGTPARWCWRDATSPPISIITLPIPPRGTSSQLSRGWSWRAATAATAGSSNRSAATASARAHGRLTPRITTRDGLTMFWSARGGTSWSWASSPCGTRSPRWPIMRRRPRWWSWRRRRSVSTACSRTSRDFSSSRNSWAGKVNF